MSGHPRWRHRTRLLVFLLGWTVYMSPLLWLLLTALKNRVDAVAIPPRLLFHPTFVHFRTALIDRGFGRALLNSLIVAAASSAGVTIIGFLSAYAVLKARPRTQRSLLFSVLATRMVPPIALVVPLYLVFRSVGLLDSLVGVTLVHAIAGLGFVIWMLAGYIAEVPKRLHEIAALDGLSESRFLLTILVPFLAPALTATAVFTFLFSWNEYLFASIFSAFEAQTIPVGIPGLVSHYGTYWEQVAAVAVISVLPALVIVALAARPLTRMLSFGIVHEVQ